MGGRRVTELLYSPLLLQPSACGVRERRVGVRRVPYSKKEVVRQNLMEPGKNCDKHDITTADAWWQVDHTHKPFKLYDLEFDLG